MDGGVGRGVGARQQRRGAKGLAPVAEMDEDDWRWMWEANVLSIGLMTRAMLPQMRALGGGHVVIMGSAAGVESYPGGAATTPPSSGPTPSRTT
nr:SDR family NAD(P)-dependent oxidoreductase [Rubrobacter marinus]